MTIFQIIQNETPGRVYEGAKKRNRVKRWFCVDWGILDIGGKGKKTEKIFKKRLAKSWILDYTKKACESLPQALLMLKNNAMTQEVAELSGNFRRELPLPDRDEGIRHFSGVYEKKKHTEACQRSARAFKKPRTRWKMALSPRAAGSARTRKSCEKAQKRRPADEKERTPCARIAKIELKKQEEQNERITENQNQA